MARKPRKLEEELAVDVSMPQGDEVLTAEVTKPMEESEKMNEELEMNPDMEADIVEDSPIVEEAPIVEHETKVEEVKDEKKKPVKETVKDEPKKVKVETEEHKKKVAQRFFGNYVWNGLISDVIIFPKKK